MSRSGPNRGRNAATVSIGVLAFIRAVSRTNDGDTAFENEYRRVIAYAKSVLDLRLRSTSPGERARAATAADTIRRVRCPSGTGRPSVAYSSPRALVDRKSTRLN